MSITLKPICLAFATLVLSAPAWAVDLVGVHDLALQNDPRLQAAASRLEATRENKTIARANLLPQIGVGASLNYGDSETTYPNPFPPPDTRAVESDIYTDSYGAELRQSLYRQANY